MNTEPEALARADLRAFVEARPNNFWSADPHLRHSVLFWAGGACSSTWQQMLLELGASSATQLDELVADVDRHPPVLQGWNAVGDRLERVVHHPAHDRAGDIIYGSRVLEVLQEPGHGLLALALFYLSSLHGEAGHNCAVVCAAGAISAIQSLGSAACREQFLPGLFNTSYRNAVHAAQFLTELQGGSDVGANSMQAEPTGDPELWRLRGNKWFCSNAGANIMLLTARPIGAPAGTRGLGLFLVPRQLESGEPNGLSVRRLKDKLGTRALATAEIDFHGAKAWQLGPLEHGFRNLMRFVIAKSRLYNAVGTAAVARRAWEIARRYARHRHAFGARLSTFPMVQATLADMEAESAAALSGVFELAAGATAGEAARDVHTSGFLRMAVNLTKLHSARVATRLVRSAIEVLGGNGTLEDFSPLPRLLRDSIVFETWEGTPNVLLLQTLRDSIERGHHSFYVEHLVALCEGHEELLSRVAEAARELAALQTMSPELASLRVRDVAERVTCLHWAAALYRQGADPRLLEHYLDLRVRPPAPRDAAYLLRVASLASD